MSKRQLIDEIRSMNRTALPEFLARFDEVDLNDYLGHLQRTRKPRLTGDATRYARFFKAPVLTQEPEELMIAPPIAVMEDVEAAAPAPTTLAPDVLQSPEPAAAPQGPQWRQPAQVCLPTPAEMAQADDEWQDEETQTISYSTTYVAQADDDQEDQTNDLVTSAAQTTDAADNDSWLFK